MGLWRHGTGYSLIGEPGQIPAIALGDTLNGAALDLDAHAVAGLLGHKPDGRWTTEAEDEVDYGPSETWRRFKLAA